MIALTDISKNYAHEGTHRSVLKGISLYIEKGEFVSILGASGSGKSTLLSILGALSSPSEGKYQLDGKVVSTMSAHELATLRNRKFGFIFQDFHLLDDLSVIENIGLPLFYAGVTTHERKERALDKLKAVGLAEKASFFPNQLSGGQKQRVAIARALVNHPLLILADEPTGALDARSAHDILMLLRQLNEQGHTIIQVTHASRDAAFSKRMIHLENGKLMKDERVATEQVIGLTERSAESEYYRSLWRVFQLAPPAQWTGSVVRELWVKSSSPEAKVEALKAITRAEDEEICRLGFKLAFDEPWMVRREAVNELKRFQWDFVLPFFELAVQDSNSWVRFGALVALYSRHQDCGDIPPFFLSRALGDSDERVRSTALSILGKMQKPEYETLFREKLHDPDPRVRATSLGALRKLNSLGESSKQIFEQYLQDPHPRVAANALVGMFFYESVSVKKQLEERLNHSESSVRASSAWAFGEINHQDSVEPLLKRLAVERETFVTDQIVRSLGKIGGILERRKVDYQGEPSAD